MDRRHFISGLSLLGAGAASYPLWNNWISSKADPNDINVLLGGGEALINDKTAFFLGLLDLNKQKQNTDLYAMKFFPHGFAFHPKLKNIVSVFEKKGPGACEFNLQTKKFRPLEIPEARHFYGHGSYSLNGDYIYVVETVLDSSEGLISVRDSKTLKSLGTFPTYGKNPHDCKLIENGKVLAVTNAGGDYKSGEKGCVTYMDVKSEMLLDKFEMTDPHYNTGHLDISQNKELVVVSAPRSGLKEFDQGAISLSDGKGALRVLKKPEDIIQDQISETLSVCIDSDRARFAATSPKGGFVSFWSLPEGEFMKRYKFHNARGVVLSQDKSYYIVSYSEMGNLAFIDAETLALQEYKGISGAGFSGSHLYLWTS